MADITIVGGINIDIEGRPYAPLRREDSNPGKISIAYGGVGRNITENVARMGGRAAMISMIGEDHMGRAAREHLRELGAREGRALAGALELDELAASRHDDVGVDLGGRVLFIAEVEQRNAAAFAYADGGYLVFERDFGNFAVGAHSAQRVEERDEARGYRRGPRAAVGLQNVAVYRYRALAEARHVYGGAQRAAYEPLYLAAARVALSAAYLALHAALRRAREHRVFRRYPAAARATKEWRHFVVYRSGAEDVRVAPADEGRALGVAVDGAFENYRAQHVAGAPVCAERLHASVPPSTPS